jgi:exodeoxyribonuclease V beta subunit
MSNRERFDLLNFPLDGGFRVVEAGAGSGKTYNLIRLVLRLITRAKDPIDIRKVLLVTFTDAAALEMRQRLRGILEQAQRTNLKGDLAEIMCVGKPTERLCRRRVSRALDNLGAMQVTTIHGFCLRAYGDHGVNAGFSPLPGDPIDGADLAAEIASDWMRIHAESAHKQSTVAAAAQALFLSPEATLPEDLESLRSYVKARVEGSSVVTFDHLITRLRDALIDTVKGPALTEALQADYQACLVDESQDTDLAQWEIFDRLFGPKSKSRSHFFLMVGDPKQSIYGFRGADVNTYFTAAKQADKIYTLPDNYRSSPRILEAFNSLFRHPKFFGEGVDITYETANPGKDAKGVCEIVELGSKPFEVVHSDKPADVAREAARLLHELDEASINRDGKVGLGTAEQPAPRAEVGILVRSNNEAAKVYRALISEGLGASLESQQSVFETTTAFQVQLLLRAVIRPAHSGNRRALLLSRPALFGPDAKLDNDTDNALSRWLSDAQSTWLKYGFAAAWERLTRKAPADNILSIVESLARSHFRNRALMDLSHVGEILIARSRRNHWTPDQTFDHLTSRIKLEDDGEGEGANASDEESLRSDLANARILVRTIHKSKGLEYNAVILAKCFSGRAAQRRKGTVVRRTGQLTTLYMGDKNDPAAADLERQVRAEDARLLYVALTRARHRLVWMGKALEPTDKGKDPTPHGFSRVLAEIDLSHSLTPTGLGSVLPALTAHLVPTKPKDPAEAPEAPPVIYIPKLLDSPSVLQRSVGATSYSGLTQGKHQAATFVPGMDQPAENKSTIDALLIPEKLKAGNLLGNLLHKLMEILDFKRAVSDADYLSELVEAELAKSAIISATSPDFAPTVAELCKSIVIWLNQPLRAHSSTPFCLADLDPIKQLAEVRFSFAADINDSTFPLLDAAFAKEFGASPYPGLANLGLKWGKDAPLRGLLTGSVDFVCAHDGRFYIIDWKSNTVGKSASDYLPGALARSIEDQRYHLQFSIYCLALDAHLRRCLGDRWDFVRDFGGVYYIYLRGFGFDPAGPNGAFYHRPSPAFLESLRKIFQPSTLVR